MWQFAPHSLELVYLGGLSVGSRVLLGVQVLGACAAEEMCAMFTKIPTASLMCTALGNLAPIQQVSIARHCAKHDLHDMPA